MKIQLILLGAITLTLGHAAEVVAHKINLLQVMQAGGMDYHINPKLDVHDAPADIFQLQGEELHISGRGYGYMVTKQEYRDYAVILEFKWGEKTWGRRQGRARDNGLLVHARGPHGAAVGSWMASFEAQIIEGGTGDFLMLSPTLEGGQELTSSLTCEVERDAKGQWRWKKGSPRQILTKGRVNWAERDEAWVDKIGFRGKTDLDAPPGEWNRVEVIAAGGTLRYIYNGRLVNEGFDASPSEGKICLQTEGAEMIVRRYELWPLGTFKETWPARNSTAGAKTAP